MGDLTDHFSRKEFACKCGCGFDDVDIRLVQALEMMRNKIGKPIIVHSGCRCYDRNEYVEGSPKSQHLLGKAADIVVNPPPGLPGGIKPHDLAALAAKIKIFERGGIGIYAWGIHVDIRDNGPARWDFSKGD